MSVDKVFNSELRKAPHQTKTRLVFKFNRKANAFDLDKFSEDQTYQIFRLSDIVDVTNRLRKSKNYKIKSYDWIGLILCLLGYGILIGVSIAYGTGNSRNNRSGSSNSSTSSMVYFLIYGSYVVFYLILFSLGICVRKITLTYLKNREKAFKKTLDKANAETYNGKGAEWKVGKFGAWIELHVPYMAEVIDNPTPTPSNNLNARNNEYVPRLNSNNRAAISNRNYEPTPPFQNAPAPQLVLVANQGSYHL